MELHRNTGRVFRNSVLILAFGVLIISVPALLALIGRRFFLGPWLWYLLGGAIILAGILSIYNSFRPFKFVANEHELVVVDGGLKVRLPWQAVEAITIERLESAQEQEAPYLILWPSLGAVNRKPSYTRKSDGRKGFHLIDIDDLRETPQQAAELLSNHVGPKFAVIGTLPERGKAR